ARARHGDARERRHHVPPSPCLAHRQSAHRRAPLPRAGGHAPRAAQARDGGGREAGHGRGQQGRHGRPRVRQRRLRERRQDRHGAGDRHQAEREVRRGEGRRAAPRPLVVHRLRPGRAPTHRARGAGGERRLRRPLGSAHRARDARLLPARQGAAGAQGSRARRRGRSPGGSGLMELAQLPLRRVAARLVSGIDGGLFVITLMLTLLGLAALFSASYDAPERMMAQGANLAVALAAMWIVANIPPQLLLRLAVPAYLVGLALLVAVALFGEVVNGARRWLDVGIIRFQPSEMMKIAMPMMLAWYFHRRETTLSLQDFVVAAILLGVPVGLVLRQPDLG